MTMHLATAKDSKQTYCKAEVCEKSKVTTSFYVADCLSCLRTALNQSRAGLAVIKGVLAEALPD